MKLGDPDDSGHRRPGADGVLRVRWRPCPRLSRAAHVLRRCGSAYRVPAHPTGGEESAGGTFCMTLVA